MDPLTLVMLAVLAVLVFFMFRNGRKRQKDQAALQSQMVAGAEVMTNFGMYGTILSIDEEANKVALEIAPGTVVHLHRQTIARVVEPTVAETESEVEPAPTAQLNKDDAIVMGEPEFGQRVTDAESDEEPKKGDA
ncbi:preprotein translocase subunit YajC [Cryobacterium sp. MP_M5]|uniref:preprotein translocase subunit YajC n=1 Tax=unclassified Cryobacterium TaxID=2649013 RepID=UPI0018CBAE79|nr:MULTISPECIES: preprotein translocase subunit YajC [unclassified Cryobacterium]MBG6059827.1 preprotein translocase subunit YajC [Cryobacterium sp. MP_M3]MEC5178199.1 preprotein translocase subunit YajC [Cryobacterium sp. MP_M5]